VHQVGFYYTDSPTTSEVPYFTFQHDHPISLADFGWRVNHLKCLISPCLQKLCLNSDLGGPQPVSPAPPPHRASSLSTHI